ncbi:MAG: CCA tRNA nucleotidyltransferase [Terracidiphilus sp.]|nr:CCA tRNA nucleotidyltransferase [Terracidiphilus sp.]
MKTRSQFAAALRILARLRAEGYEAYLAGGCVRDLVLGREPKDYDVATSARPEVVLDLFPRTFAVGAKFGVVLVCTCGAAELLEGNAVTEVATFRSDGEYSDGRHPDAVRYTLSAGEDVERRDFTINGLLLDPLRGGGVLDGILAAGTEGAEKDGGSGDSCDPTLAAKTKTRRGWGTQRSLAGREASSQVPEAGAGVHGDCSFPPIPAEGAEMDGAWSGEGWTQKNNRRSFDSLRCASVAQDDSLQEEKNVAQDDSVEGGEQLFDLCGAHSGKEKIRAAVVDYVGGLADLDAGVIRAIGRPEARFEEDHLRMLRAVRFAARFGFEIDPGTEVAIRGLAPRIAAVSRERVRDELTKMLTEGRARRAFELLLATGLLAEVLPEAARMVGVEQPPQFHPEGDVWTHILLVLDQLEPGCSMTLAWGALLHDVGKPATFSRGADRIHFNGHADVGVAIAGELCRRFRFSNEETRQIVKLVGNHMRFMDAQRMKDATLKRFFRLGRFEEHLALHRMDCVASNGDLSNWEYALRRWQETPEAEVRPQLLVTGRELIEAGYRPGAGFRPMLEAVEEAQLEGTIRTAEEGLKLVRERFGGPGE